MSAVERNSRIRLHYQLGSVGGDILEDNFDEEPMTVNLGRGEMAEGLELALIGLREGEEQTIDIGPDLAFGYSDDTLIRVLPRAEFDPQFDLDPGLIIEFSTDHGETLPGTIVDFDDLCVTVDMNHPLAGQTVRYRVRIVAIESSATEPGKLH